MRLNVISMLAGLLLSGLIAVSASAAPLAGDPARGYKLSKPCADCHGAGGVAPDEEIPNLAGQKANYLEKQLRDMRTSANRRAGLTLSQDLDKNARFNQYHFTRIGRSNEMMDPFIIDLTDQNIADLAAHYARLPCGAKRHLPQPNAPVLTVRCGTCHGPAGISRTQSIANIAGQPQPYLKKRLLGFREIGMKLTKKERRRNIMATQARLLTDTQIGELTQHYASLACR